jgi:hypothetical protein
MPREFYEIIDIRVGKPATLSLFETPELADRQVRRIHDREVSVGSTLSELEVRPVDWDWLSE